VQKPVSKRKQKLIKLFYATGEISSRKLGKALNVSKDTVIKYGVKHVKD
jgi:biotin operon repressor